MSILPASSASTMGGPPCRAVTTRFSPCLVKKPSYSATSKIPPLLVAGPDRAICRVVVTAEASDPLDGPPELHAATEPPSRTRQAAATLYRLTLGRVTLW